MPRLLPVDWIKLVAINYLLQLYERESQFVQELEKVKQPFAPIVERLARASVLNDVERLVTWNPPRDLMAWISDRQKLRKYIQALEGVPDLSQLQESYQSLLGQLAPCVLRLGALADNWNLRAPWAGDELMWRYIRRIQQDILDAAEAASLFELSDQQIQRLVETDEGRLPSDDLPINVLSLYLAGGRRDFTNKLNRRLKEFEQKLKASGAREPPSALRIHAEWWFDHYVYGMKFPDIANGTIGPNNEAGRYPQNIRNAVLKFSALLGIEPVERA
jgi:hypothetical protein